MQPFSTYSLIHRKDPASTIKGYTAFLRKLQENQYFYKNIKIPLTISLFVVYSCNFSQTYILSLSATCALALATGHTDTDMAAQLREFHRTAFRLVQCCHVLLHQLECCKLNTVRNFQKQFGFFFLSIWFGDGSDIKEQSSIYLSYQ